MTEERITIEDRPAASRYELLVDGALAGVCEYDSSADTVTFTHTEVFPGHEGKGLGSRLASFVLDDAKQRGMRVVPACSYIARYLRGHDEYKALVPDDIRSAMKL